MTYGMTINNILQKKQETGEPLVNTDGLKADFITEYIKNSGIIDIIIANKHGERESKVRTIHGWDALTRAFVYSKMYMLEKLFNTLSLEYNPINNYDMTEHEDISEDNLSTENRVKGKQVDDSTTDFSVVHTETDVSAYPYNVSVNEGAKTDIISNDTVQNVAPYEDSTQHPKEWVNTDGVNSYGAKQTSTDYGKQQSHGTEDVGAHNQYTQSITGDRTDTGSKKDDNSSVRMLTRSGNIGVTTSQQMIKSEREDVARFDFWEEFAKELVAFCCTSAFSVCVLDVEYGEDGSFLDYMGGRTNES